MNLFKRGDQLLERLSKSKHLFSITFVLAFLEASISPFLPEAFVAIILAYQKKISWILLSLVSALGSSFGALFMYLVGMTLYREYGEAILTLLHGEGLAGKAKILFEQNAFFAQFFASLTPLPDRVFSFLAGAFVISPVIIFVATFLGRFVRVAPVAYLSYEYGDEAREYIKKHSRRAGIALVVLVACYFLYVYFVK